jgi:hypothetical protein
MSDLNDLASRGDDQRRRRSSPSSAGATVDEIFDPAGRRLRRVDGADRAADPVVPRRCQLRAEPGPKSPWRARERLKYALKGGTYTAQTQAQMPLDEWRLYMLVKITGWTLDQIGDAPAETLDWFLELHTVEVEIANENAEQARKRR